MKLILFVLVLILLIVPVNAVDWHDDTRLKRIQLNINNSSVALTDYQIMKNITYDSNMQTDFDDLLFYNESGGTVPYWIESKTDSSTADLWLKISSISTTEGAKLWMYYENVGVSSASSGSDVFELFDDFETTGAGDWITVYGSPDYDSTTQAKSPTHALKLNIGDVWEECYVSLNASDNIVIEHWTYCDSNSHAFDLFKQGDGSKRAVIEADSSNNIRYYDGSWHDTGINVVLDSWKKLIVYDFDWSAGTFKFNYDGNVASCNMQNSDVQVDGIYLSVRNGMSYFDDVFVRKYTAIEPMWGADGEEESYEAPPPPTGVFLYPNSTFSVGWYGRLTSELVYETGINFSDIDTFNLLTAGDMEVMSVDDTNYIPSIDKDAAHDGYMYGNFSLPNVETVNFINVKTVHNRNGTNPVILGLFNVSTQKWHAVNNSSVEIVDVELTYNITGTDIIKYTTLTNNVLNLSVSLNTNGDGNYDVFVDFVEVYIDYEESPDITLEYVYNLTISNQNNISILQNDVNNLKNSCNNLHLFVLLCTIFLVATLRKRSDQ